MDTQKAGNTVREIRYVPRSIGSSRPMGDYANEFVIFADATADMGQILNFIFRQGLPIKRLRTQSLSQEGRDQEWACLFIADFQGANQSPLELSSKIKKLGGVTDVSYASRKKSTFGFFSFPVLMNDKSRAYIMRGEVLMKVEEDLTKTFGSSARAIMFQEGRSFGRGVVEVHSDHLGMDADLNIRSQSVKDASRAAGLGILDYNFSEDKDVVNVILRDPLTDSSRDCRSHFVFGILAGLIEKIHGISLSVKSWTYNKETKILLLKLGINAKTPADQ